MNKEEAQMALLIMQFDVAHHLVNEFMWHINPKWAPKIDNCFKRGWWDYVRDGEDVSVEEATNAIEWYDPSVIDKLILFAEEDKKRKRKTRR